MLYSQSTVNYSCLFMNTIQMIQLYHSSKVNCDETFNQTEKIAKFQYHVKERADLQQILKTDSNYGLTQEQARLRYSKNGSNTLNLNKIGIKQIFRRICKILNFYSIIIFTVGSGFLVATILQSKQLFGATMPYFVSAFMIAIALLWLLMNIILEVLSISHLKQPSFNSVMVRRTNSMSISQVKKINPKRLVQGDVILIKQNMMIPADIRIIQSQNLIVDKTWNGRQGQFGVVDSVSGRKNILKSDNMIFCPSRCVSGTGLGIVVGTGDNTIISLILKEKEQAESKKFQNSKIKNELHVIITTTSCLSFCMAVIYLFIQTQFNFIQGSWFTDAMGAVGVVLAFIPLSLPFQIYSMLAIFKQQSKKHNISVKNFLTFEKVRQIDCLVLDSSGILTNNQCQLINLYYNNKITNINNSKSEIFSNQQDFESLRQCVFLSKSITIDPSIQKILNYFQQISPQAMPEYSLKYQKQEIPEVSFEHRSTDPAEWYEIQIRKYKEGNNYNYCIFMVGQVTAVWENSSQILIDNKRKQKSAIIKQQFLETIKDYERNGLKIIGYAKVDIPNKFNQFNIQHIKDYIKKMTFIGFVSLKIGINLEAFKVISEVKQAGIEVVLMSDDSFRSTCCLAQSLGLIGSQRATQLKSQLNQSNFEDQINQQQLVISRKTFKEAHEVYKRNPDLPFGMTKWFLKASVKQLVFSEVNSSHKNILMNFLNTHKRKICFMTTDDKCLALMKNFTTSVTYSSAKINLQKGADVIINSNQFQKIIQIIRLSRDSYTNLKKSLVFNLSIQFSKIGFILGFIIFGRSFTPLISVFICIQFIGTFIPGICFAFDQSEQTTMTQHPKQEQASRFIHTPVILQSYFMNGSLIFVGGLICFILALDDYGFNHFNVLSEGLKQVWTNNKDKHFWTTLSGRQYVFNPPTQSTCKIVKTAIYTDPPYQICYTFQALRYAQWSFYCGILVCQFFNVILCQLRSKTIFKTRWNNSVMMLGVFLSISLSLVISYSEPISSAFESKDNNFMHMGVNAATIGILMITIDEIKKLILKKYCKYDEEESKNMLSTILKW